MTEEKIPIRNIYYILCYAWDVAPIIEDDYTCNEKFENIYDLLCQLLINNLEFLIKKGLCRSYVERTEELTSIRGKIDFDSSFKMHSIQKRRLYCIHDEMDLNIPLNQIIKWALNYLLEVNDIKKEQKQKLKKLQQYFYEISELVPEPRHLRRLSFFRNNSHYRLLIHVSELIYRMETAKEEGNWHAFKRVSDNYMNEIYERFLYNYYKKYINKNFQNYKIDKNKIKWDFIIEEEDDQSFKLLPFMNPDIVISETIFDKCLVIDAKYYKGGPVKIRNFRGGDSSKKLIPEHLYQIFSYVTNTSKTNVYKRVDGMLIYPTINEELDLKYHFKNESSTIYVKTLDLSQDWENIEKRLTNIFEESMVL